MAQCASLEIPESTLLICFSPLLGYGLAELIEKLPASSFMLAVEYDQQLMRLSLDYCDFTLFKKTHFSYIRTDSVADVLKKIETVPSFPFKKCITISLSGGVQLYQQFYSTVSRYADDLMAQFWKNRITLMQLGRNYVHNTFRNLLLLKENGFPLSGVSTHCVRLLTGRERIVKPVFVAGAGPSLDSMRSFLRQYRSSFFLLAVDAAAPALLPEIRPDAIILVESQYWIDSAFIGLKKYGIPVFADITASPRALEAAGGAVSFFCTKYARLRYLTRLYKTVKPLILQPMGSVGLTALQFALVLSAPELPIFHIGLDFSWGNGLTHAACSSPIKKLYAETCRIKPLYALNLSADIQRLQRKHEQSYWTRPILASYAAQYRQAFGTTARIIDLNAKSGLLNSRYTDEAEAARLLTYFSSRCTVVHAEAYEKFSSESIDGARNPLLSIAQADEQYGAVCAYLAEEAQRLTALNGHLQSAVQLPAQYVENLIADGDYLYSHFPDAARGYSLDTGFLKRVSIELRYLLKILR